MATSFLGKWNVTGTGLNYNKKDVLSQGNHTMTHEIECVMDVQGNPRSLSSVPIESSYATSY